MAHLEGAVTWLLAARDHARDGGIPAFFHLMGGGWTDSYAETTGYTIPTLLACSDALQQPRLADLGLELARWLLTVRTDEGGVGYWRDKDSPPIVFDTGQALFGWLAAWQYSGDVSFLEAAVKAGSWLTGVQSDSGAWSQFQHNDVVKTIDTRVSWALLLLQHATGKPEYEEAARRNLGWTLSEQSPNGWFRRAILKPTEHPSTHTLCYTAEGLLECGLLLGEPEYMTAAQKTARALFKKQRRDGSLAYMYDAQWRARRSYSCLTGNCQAALLWLRLHGLQPEEGLLTAAWDAIAYVAGAQDLETSHPGVRGGIAGQYPLWGGYARFRYVNWAAKFFADSLLALQQVEAMKGFKARYPG